MTETKPGKKPADHKRSAEAIHEENLKVDDMLADMPELRPPHRLRLKHRNRLQFILIDSNLADLMDDDKLELDISKAEDRAKIRDLMSFSEQVDEFAESIAVNPEAYAEWAEGKDVDHMFAIFSRYMGAEGESDGSAN